MTNEADWKSAMRANGIDVDSCIAMLDQAVCQPGIPADEEIALAEIALQHSADMFTAGKLSLAIAFGREARALSQSLRKELALIPEVNRDRARQKGPHAKNVELQNAVNKLVARFPDLTAGELWGQASDVITDQVGFDRFRKRVADARKLGRK